MYLLDPDYDRDFDMPSRLLTNMANKYRELVKELIEKHKLEDIIEIYDTAIYLYKGETRYLNGYFALCKISGGNLDLSEFWKEFDERKGDVNANVGD